MKALIYPHTMQVGGAQLNAIQVAGALQRRGHEVAVVSDPGPLVARVHAEGLEHIALPARRRSPSPTVALWLGDIVRRRGFDVVHGHEWPPIIETYFGVGLPRRAAAVGTIMSMSVPSFLPRALPLTVGTEAIRGAALAAGFRNVFLLEPPVDDETDRPGCDGASFRLRHGVAAGEVLVGVVCRLAADLKLEGLLAACDAALAAAEAGEPVRLAIVGDGPARAQVAARAEAANAALGRKIIFLAGEMADPRPAYAACDIVVGQGGSALRGMAFAKPLIVVGESGFSEMLTPASAPIFLGQGWFGLGPGSRGAGAPALRSAISELIAAPDRRAELGAFGRRLVEQRFSLTSAARTVEALYETAAGLRGAVAPSLAEAAACAVRLAGYKLARKANRWRGVAVAEDANARAKIAAVLALAQRRA